jgi:hypothetical protein
VAVLRNIPLERGTAEKTFPWKDAFLNNINWENAVKKFFSLGRGSADKHSLGKCCEEKHFLG